MKVRASVSRFEGPALTQLREAGESAHALAAAARVTTLSATSPAGEVVSATPVVSSESVINLGEVVAPPFPEAATGEIK